jgi:hypothetical protein
MEAEVSSLSPETRALIAAAGDSDRPTSDERARLRAALVSRIGISTAVAGAAGSAGQALATASHANVSAGTATTAASASNGAATVGAGGATAGALGAAKGVIATSGGLSLAAKMAGMAVIASGIALSAASGRNTSDALQGATESVASAPSAVVTQPPPATAPLGAPQATHEARSVNDLPQAQLPATPAVTTKSAPPSVQRPAPRGEPFGEVTRQPESFNPAATAGALEPMTPVTENSITAETELLQRAHARLIAGDATGALVLLEEHARTFPAGVLVEERDAERVAALCATGQVERARAEATKFITAHPGSTVASRVRRTCEAH